MSTPNKNQWHGKWDESGGRGPSRSLLIIGDSITLGVTEVRGSEATEKISPSYVELLRREMPEVNIQVDAELQRNSSDVSRKIDEILSRQHIEAVLLMIGGSDADVDWKRFVVSDGSVARSRVSVERYEKNLQHITAKVLAAGGTPILTDMPNHHLEMRGPYIAKLSGKDVVALINRGGGQAESDKHLVLFRQAVGRVSKELGLELVRFGEVLDAQDPKEILSVDGAHPNEAGHRVIAEALAPVIQRFFRPRRSELRA